MKPMIWHPEESDAKVNQYLNHINREPWLAIFAGVVLFFLLFTILIFLGMF